MKYDARNKMRAATLLSQVDDRVARLAFFDPQYRGLLDAMAYGNEGKDKSRQRARARLPQMRDGMIRHIIGELERALAPSGHLMLWIDKFTLAEGIVYDRWVGGEPPSKLKTVDLLHWNKLRTGMGRRLRCRSEYLLIFQKPPIRAKGVWSDHGIDDTWAEMSDREVHTHAKPVELTRRLIRATTKIGDLVLDPAAGGYGVLTACRLTRRRFLGCDIATEVDGD